MSAVRLVDYGSGNLGSLLRALSAAGCRDVEVVTSPSKLKGARGVVIPGVGSFASGMDRLRRDGWEGPIREHASQEGFILGICAGMQFLATTGTEGGVGTGLDLIPGDVVSLDSVGCKERLPHAGWNGVLHDGASMFDGIPSGVDLYFSHRYTFVPTDPACAVGRFLYGVEAVAAVSSGRIHGIQFHPEKSSFAGIRVLQNLLETVTA